MNYTLHQLQIFREVVRQKSITRAAEVMHMTQPALSIQLKKFQEQFSIPLTELIGKQIRITEFGNSIAGLADSILREAAVINQRTKEFEGLLTGQLRIASASTGKYVAPYFLADFLAQHEGITLDLDVSNKSKVLQSLQQGEVDFALVSTVPNDLNIEEKLLLENRLYLVAGTKKTIRKNVLILREAGSATRQAMEGFFKYFPEAKVLVLTSNEAVKQAVIAGLGISILPIIGIRNELHSGQLQILPFKKLPISTYWRLIWIKSRKLSPVAQAYLSHIEEEGSSIADHHFKWYQSFKNE